MDPAELMTIHEALEVFHALGRGSRERQALALEILDALDRSSLASVTWAKVPIPWRATDRRRANGK